ncbi:O-methyltransferase [Streptantibioticus rubrisoli]|uniref:Class I SAM-dependent methyltransferase n=1 Tax=Streptantibioticus rubrisoli TaxID=1387313 RepID=A0ABT1PJT4_9ACTN|nr:class I SAM-dependent methyltransferase [Streptantibioticus rubrisoli]MCQ4045627.1 class I SAM-dependent methyltransferase [Streptantibioticus rubrisoli]
MANQLGLPARLSEYIRESSLREDEVLRQLRETTSELPAGSALQVMPEEGQLLTLLAGLTRARKILEIGTYTGYSTLCLARALAPGGRLVTCDITHRWPRIGAEYWTKAGVDGRIDLRIGDAANTLEALLADEGPGTFDFVFIDADKQRYSDYYESALSLVGDHGLIVVDNTLFFGKVVDPEAQDPDTTAIRAFNTLVRDDPRVETSLVPMADGITLIRKKQRTGE